MGLQDLASPAIVGSFYEQLADEYGKSWASSLGWLNSGSNQDTETYKWLGNSPKYREWVNGRAAGHPSVYSYSIKNKIWEQTLEFPIDDLRRDKTGQIRQRIGDLGARAGGPHWNELVGTYITNGEAGSSGLAYDGQFFFDTDHNESGSNQTNDLTATEVPSANVNTTSTLTTTEAAGIITETIAYMMGHTDDQGEPINQGPTSVLIVTTKPGHFAGIKTALSVNNLGTGSGNNNPLLAWSDFPISTVYVPQRVTAADKLYFFFGTPEMGGTPFIRTVEQDVTTRMLDETFKNRRLVFGVDAVRGLAYGMWQKAALVTLS